jgi:hypothetical protein
MTCVKKKCLESFIDWRDMKTLSNSYAHECKKHVYQQSAKSQAEAAAKIFLMAPAETSFDPCKEVEETKKESDLREAEWKKECSCNKLEGVV